MSGPYTVVEIDTGNYVVHGLNNTLIEDKFQPVSLPTATLLCEDFNSIWSYNESRFHDTVHEYTLEDFHDNEYLHSIAYILIDFLRKNKDNKTYHFYFYLWIHWDRMFRIADDPIYGQRQLDAIACLKPLLQSTWVTLPEVGPETIDEMLEDGLGHVSDEIIQELKLVYDQLSIAERFIIYYMFLEFNHFSVTLPLFMVTGKVDVAKVIHLYDVTSLREVTSEAEQREKQLELDNLQQRLAYLLKVRDSLKLHDPQIYF
jgi:hypothetical protein